MRPGCRNRAPAALLRDEALVLERLARGSATIAELRDDLAARFEQMAHVEQAVKRLATQGHVDHTETVEGFKRTFFYQLTADGRARAEQLQAEREQQRAARAGGQAA